MRFLHVPLLLLAFCAPATVYGAVSKPTSTVTTPAAAKIRVSPSEVSRSKPVSVPQFRPPVAGAAPAKLVAAGKAIIRRQAALGKTMMGTTGFTNLDEIAKSVSALGPTRAKAVSLLRSSDGLEFVIRAPGSARNGITERGFLNQHESGSSRGTFAPGTRADVEASFLGVTREQYDKLPNNVRPKYGYLRPSPNSGLTMQDNATQYGEDVFVFKHDAVKNHVTFYPNDSLGYSAHGWPVSSGATAQPKEWHHLLQPWSHRMLLAPSLQVDNGQLTHTSQTPTGFKNYNPRWGNRYLEIQIWRPIGLPDVERFEFSSTPPSGAFLKALRDNGVKIYQSGSKEEWKGDHTTSLYFFFPRVDSAPLSIAA